MSRSQKWKDEWAFFLDGDGRRKYAELCRRCIHDCKQSFHAEVITCPGYRDHPKICVNPRCGVE